jgi:hypothetical protein
MDQTCFFLAVPVVSAVGFRLFSFALSPYWSALPSYSQGGRQTVPLTA